MQTISASHASEARAALELDRLAKTWIFAQKIGVGNLGYERHRWAVDHAIDLAFHEPNKLWQLILRILEIDKSDAILSAVGGGPLEDLVVQHGEALIDRIEQQAAKSPALKSAMHSTWLEEGDTPVCNRFLAIAGIKRSAKSGKR